MLRLNIHAELLKKVFPFLYVFLKNNFHILHLFDPLFLIGILISNFSFHLNDEKKFSIKVPKEDSFVSVIIFSFYSTTL